MKLPIDADVKKVIAFMQNHVPAAKLVAVADSIKKLATPLWGHHQSEIVVPMSLRNKPISSQEQPPSYREVS
jgi:hypothetical protein